MNLSAPAPNIMVVDDEPANLRLIEEMLQQKGYEVRSFPRGRLALAAAAKQPPDLILLDVTMPELTGYEVCERLKSDPDVSQIPVIFLSALSATEDKVKAFRSGGVDYISKPFQLEEVYARVATHLNLHHLQRALQLHNEQLEETVALRTRELAEANQRLTILDRSKSEFLDLISHEFRTPLNGLLGAGELILEGMPATAENRELQDMFERSRQRMLSLLDDGLLLTQIDVNAMQFRSVPVSLRTILGCSIERTIEFAESRRVAVTPPADSNQGCVLGNEDLLIKGLHALLETAVRFSAEGEAVELSSGAVPGFATVIIESHGKTIPAACLGKFFDVFSISESNTAGSDLGLRPALAHRILSLFGASVSVANREPCGIRWTIALKAA
jgi:DNA-binding response OmpR family regulator